MAASRVGFGVVVIVFPAYLSGASDLEVAGALALYPLAEAAMSLPVGFLCDSRGRKAVFAASLAAMAVLMASIALTRNIYVVAGIHAAMGVGAAGVTVSTLAIVTDSTAPSTRGAGMGGFDLADIGGYAVGIVLGARLSAAFPHALGSAFLVTSLVVASALAVVVLGVREPPRRRIERQASSSPLSSLDARGRAALPLWFGVTVLLGTVFFLPRAFARSGISLGATSDILVVGIAVLGAGAVGFGALSDRIGRGVVMLVGVSGLIELLVALILIFHSGGHSFVKNLPLLGLLLFTSSAIVPTVLATAGDGAAESTRGTAMGFYTTLLSVGSATGTLAAGVAHSLGGLAGVFEAACGAFFLSCLVSLVMWVRVGRAVKRKAL